MGCSASSDMGLTGTSWQLLPRGRGCGSSRSWQLPVAATVSLFKQFRLVKSHCQLVLTIVDMHGQVMTMTEAQGGHL